jgi:hypothetical protein
VIAPAVDRVDRVRVDVGVEAVQGGRLDDSIGTEAA